MLELIVEGLKAIVLCLVFLIVAAVVAACVMIGRHDDEDR